MSKRSCSVRGFTLVELLVVIGIIAVLISILLPTLGRAREQAKRVQCASNIRQLIAAYTNYATEQKGWYPATGWEGEAYSSDFWLWRADMVDTFVPKYLKQTGVLFCPGQAELFPEWKSTWYDQVYLNLYRGTSYLSFTTPAVGNPAPGSIWHYQNQDWRVRRMGERSKLGDGRRILVADITRQGRDWPAGSGLNSWYFSGHWKRNAPQGGNLGFTDGSVAWKPFADMPKTGCYKWSVVTMWW